MGARLADELLEESHVLQETAHPVREEGIRIRAAATPYMPGMSGITLIRRLKSQDSTWCIPIIVVTMADIDEETTRQALEAGGAACHVKPIKSEPFIRLIRTVMAAEPPAATPAPGVVG